MSGRRFSLTGSDLVAIVANEGGEYGVDDSNWDILGRQRLQIRSSTCLSIWSRDHVLISYRRCLSLRVLNYARERCVA